MKSILTVLACALLTNPALRAAENVKDSLDFSTLPPAVRAVAEAETAGAKVEEVEMSYEDGKQVHEVEFEKDGRDMAIVISPEGKLVLTREEIPVAKASAGLVKAVEAAAPRAKVEKITKLTKDGISTYRVGTRLDGKFKEVMLPTVGVEK